MKKLLLNGLVSVLVLLILFMPAAADGCYEDELSVYGWADTPCPAGSVNLQATPTCTTLELAWDRFEGADGYWVLHHHGLFGWWIVGVTNDIDDTSFSLPDPLYFPTMPADKYSFVVLPVSQAEPLCYSNSVCDVEYPGPCQSIPEFPSLVLPGALIIGIVGTVICIGRSRNH